MNTETSTDVDIYGTKQKRMAEEKLKKRIDKDIEDRNIPEDQWMKRES